MAEATARFVLAGKFSNEIIHLVPATRSVFGWGVPEDQQMFLVLDESPFRQTQTLVELCKTCSFGMFCSMRGIDSLTIFFVLFKHFCKFNSNNTKICTCIRIDTLSRSKVYFYLKGRTISLSLQATYFTTRFSFAPLIVGINYTRQLVKPVLRIRMGNGQEESVSFILYYFFQ